MMKVIADADLFLDLLFKCSDHQDRSLEIIMRSEKLCLYLADQCLEQACRERGKDVQKISSWIKRISNIDIIRIKDIECDRLKDAIECVNLEDWDSRVEVAYAIALDLGAICTARRENFAGANLSIVPLEDLKERVRLEKVFESGRITLPLEVESKALKASSSRTWIVSKSAKWPQKSIVFSFYKTTIASIPTRVNLSMFLSGLTAINKPYLTRSIFLWFIIRNNLPPNDRKTGSR